MKLPLPAIALIPLLGTSAIVSADSAPPVVTAFSVSPAAVDITSGDATVQVTVHITDDDSGFSYANIYLYSPANQFVTNFFFQASSVQPGGSNTDGTYISNVVVPRYGAHGNWRLEVQPVDNDGNRSDYGSSGLPFPTPGNEIIAVTNTDAVDSTPPQLASISISPSTVDVTSQDQIVSVTINATDALSGLRYGSADLYKPDGSPSYISHYYPASSGTGTPQNAVYTFNMTVPRGSDAGVWNIGNVLRDRVGNLTFANGNPGSSLTVINHGNVATGDLSDACDATQYHWTTSGDEDWFLQTTTTRDGIDAAQSGPIGDNGISQMSLQVTGPGTLTFWWKVDSQSNDSLSVFTPGPGNSTGISGSSPWLPVTLTIAPGLQTVTWSYTKDSSGSSGEDAGWVDQVYFSADTDNELPTLQYIDISPDPVSVASGVVDITVTFEVSDDNNGVANGYVDLFDSNGNNYNGNYWDSGNRVSGDEYSGTYEVTFSIYRSDLNPVGSYEPGTWRTQVSIEEASTSYSQHYGESWEPFPNPGDELFTVIGGSSGQLGILSIDSFTPDPTDITSASQTVTMEFVIDDPFQEFAYGYVYIYNPNNQYIDGIYFDSSSASGNQFSVDLTIPRYGPSGTWSVDFTLYDQTNNDTYINGSILNPGDNQFTVINNGAVDVDPPVLTAISITPGTIDTSSAAATINITAAVSDNLAGIDYAYFEFYDPTGSLVNSLFKFVDGSLIVGGSLTTSQTLPQGSALGLWRCEMVVRDTVGNYRRYGTGGTGTAFPVPADAEFTVGAVPARTYDAFTSTYLLFGIDALPGANPDSDWANNAMELLLGLNPAVATTPDPALYQMTRAGNELHLDFKVAPGLTVTPNGNFLDLTNGGSSVSFKVTGQTAASLTGPWTDTPPLPQGGGIYRVTLPTGPGGAGFCRLRFLDP